MSSRLQALGKKMSFLFSGLSRMHFTWSFLKCQSKNDTNFKEDRSWNWHFGNTCKVTQIHCNKTKKDWPTCNKKHIGHNLKNGQSILEYIYSHAKKGNDKILISQVEKQGICHSQSNNILEKCSTPLLCCFDWLPNV